MDIITLLEFEHHCKKFKQFLYIVDDELRRETFIETGGTYNSVSVRSAPDKITFNGSNGFLSIINPKKIMMGINEFGNTIFDIRTNGKYKVIIMAT